LDSGAAEFSEGVTEPEIRFSLVINHKVVAMTANKVKEMIRAGRALIP